MGKLGTKHAAVTW